MLKKNLTYETILLFLSCFNSVVHAAVTAEAEEKSRIHYIVIEYAAYSINQKCEHI